jgi:hypothetical protein
MRLPFISRRRHQRALAHQRRGYECAIQQVAEKNRGALGAVAAELSTAKDVIASHIVAAGHPSTVLHDARTFADALEQALTDAGVDIRLELARQEGAEL